MQVYTISAVYGLSAGNGRVGCVERPPFLCRGQAGEAERGGGGGFGAAGGIRQGHSTQKSTSAEAVCCGRQTCSSAASSRRAATLDREMCSVQAIPKMVLIPTNACLWKCGREVRPGPVP